MGKNVIFFDESIQKIGLSTNTYEKLQNIKGAVFRDKEGRKTIRFEFNDQSYFLKLHTGVGWKEIIKNLLSFRLPVISAKNEWKAIMFLQNHGLDTMSLAAYGEKGCNPAAKKSFVITYELKKTTSLENLALQWKSKPPSFSSKKNLIEKLAQIASTMHRHGMNHRDFYLCHFLLDESFIDTSAFSTDTELYLIDLHRAQIRAKTPMRWLIKDLGSLYFSALDVELTQRDLIRFMRAYSQKPIKNVLGADYPFWEKVKRRAQALYEKN